MNIKELLLRYNLKTRQPLYVRLNVLGITLDKDENRKAFANDEQIRQLDDLEQHLKTGGTLSSYTQTVLAELDSAIVPVSSSSETVQINLLDVVGILDRLVARSPIQSLRELEECCENRWILTTSQVKQLTGGNPIGNVWVRGSFKFIRSGKIGGQIGWLVVRNTEFVED